MNPLEQSPEHAFRATVTNHWLKARYDAGDYRGLLEAAMLLNALHQMECDKRSWAIKEAADNLADRFGMDRDSA